MRGGKAKHSVEAKKGGTVVDKSRLANPSNPDEPLVTKVRPKASAGWKISRDLEQALDPEVIADKFWNQQVQGITNADLFGGMRKDVQNAILDRSKRKRIYLNEREIRRWGLSKRRPMRSGPLRRSTSTRRRLSTVLNFRRKQNRVQAVGFTLVPGMSDM